MSAKCDAVIDKTETYMEKVETGVMSIQKATVIAKFMGEACRLGRAKTLYAIAKGEKPNIPFFED